MSSFWSHWRPPMILPWSVAVIIITIAATVWQMSHSRQEAIESAENLVSATTRIAQEHLDGAVRGVEMLLIDTSTMVQAGDSIETIAAYVVPRMASFPELRGVSLTNAKGDVYYYSVGDTPRPNLADRDHFQVHQTNTGPNFTYISRPLVDRATNRLSIFATRALRDRMGNFQGIITAVINPEFFSDTLSSVVQEAGDVASITNHDCYLISRVPEVAKLVGTRHNDSNLLCQLAKSGGTGFTRYTAVGDGITRIIAYRPTLHGSAMVVVGVPESRVLKKWRHELLIDGIGEALMIGFILLVTFFLWRKEEEARRIDQALRLTIDDLRRSNDDLERFAYAASHDLQEPIRSIVSYAQLLARKHKGRLDADTDTFLTYIVEAGLRLHGLINGLLAFSRVGSKEEPFTHFDSHAALNTALRDLAAAISESGAVIDVREPLPSLWGDYQQFVQVFDNLLGNSIKFHRPNTPPEIRIWAEDLGSQWKITFADNGIGIPQSYAQDVFIIFKRLHDRRDFPGTGIGLALVKRVIERHGGSITVKDSPLGGTAFVFTLPKTNETRRSLGNQSSEEEDSPASPRPNSATRT